MIPVEECSAEQKEWVSNFKFSTWKSGGKSNFNYYNIGSNYNCNNDHGGGRRNDLNNGYSCNRDDRRDGWSHHENCDNDLHGRHAIHERSCSHSPFSSVNRRERCRSPDDCTMFCCAKMIPSPSLEKEDPRTSRRLVHFSNVGKWRHSPVFIIELLFNSYTYSCTSSYICSYMNCYISI